MWLLWVSLGIVLGALFIIFCRQRYVVGERSWLAFGLLVAASVYALFGSTQANIQLQGIEWGGLALFGSLALLGWRSNIQLLALGWALHVFWDVFLHGVSPFAGFAFDAVVPSWYIFTCAGFDVLVASYIFQQGSKIPLEKI